MLWKRLYRFNLSAPKGARSYIFNAESQNPLQCATKNASDVATSTTHTTLTTLTTLKTLKTLKTPTPT